MYDVYRRKVALIPSYAPLYGELADRVGIELKYVAFAKFVQVLGDIQDRVANGTPLLEVTTNERYNLFFTELENIKRELTPTYKYVM